MDPQEGAGIETGHHVAREEYDSSLLHLPDHTILGVRTASKEIQYPALSSSMELFRRERPLLVASYSIGTDYNKFGKCGCKFPEATLVY